MRDLIEGGRISCRISSTYEDIFAQSLLFFSIYIVIVMMNQGIRNFFGISYFVFFSLLQRLICLIQQYLRHFYSDMLMYNYYFVVVCSLQDELHSKLSQAGSRSSEEKRALKKQHSAALLVSILEISPTPHTTQTKGKS